MERGAVRVAGLGFRQAATVDSLRAALRAAGGENVAALATLAEKATAPALLALAGALGVPVIPITAAALAGVGTLTDSPRLRAFLGTG
ncbi:MAG: cobalamin biosynthesis protein, partial [Acidocella sp.]|nr:cobalamin biosynthesis protein [Acidocella sp.]